MLIDFHTHAFPEKLAERTLEKLSAIAKIQPNSDGTVEGTRGKMGEWGVDKAVLLHIATKPSQQRTINDWARSIQSDDLLCFGTVHPDAEDAIEELYRIKEIGLHGVKFHPDYQGFWLTEDRMLPIYETLEKLGLPMIFHAGWDPISPDVVHAPVKAVVELLDTCPGLTLIGAHLGGMKQYDQVEELLAGRDIFLDVSMSSVYCGKEQYCRIVKKHGAGRLLFGSDCPWSSARAELEFLDQADFTPEERERICWKNAAELLGIAGE